MQLKKGQIVWADLNGIGSEQGGNRPCIIVQNNVGNKFSRTTILVPLTTKSIKKMLPTQLKIRGENIGKNFKDSIALTEQIKNADISRINSIQNKLPNDIIQEIDAKILISLGIRDIAS